MKNWIAFAALSAVAVTGVHAQNFPGSKPVTFVVPFAAGGPTDRVARDLAEAMRKAIPGGNFVVENTAGAGGTIAASATRYSAAIAVNADMSATTGVSFAGGSALITPFETTDDPCWITATLSVLTVPVAGKKLIFRLFLGWNR